MFEKGRLSVLVFVLGAATGCAAMNERPAQTTSVAAESLGTASSYKCDFDVEYEYAKVDAKEFAGKCFAPRGEDDDVVRIPLSSSEFATKCAITLDEPVPPASGSECHSSRQPLKWKDRIVVTEWEKGDFELHLKTVDEHGKDVRVLVPLREGAAVESGVPYLYGVADGVHYAVYLQYGEPDAQGLSDKIYRFEVFDETGAADWRECREHMPTHKPSVSDCVEATGTGGSQTGTSTGSEPPPRPKP
jgi:hypothetical protein